MQPLRTMLPVSLSALVLGSLLFQPSSSLATQPLPQILAQATDTRSTEALSYLQQGVNQYKAEQFDAAEQSFLKAFDLYSAINDRSGQWFSVFLLGSMRASMGDYAKGTHYLEQSLQLAQALNDRPKQFDSLSALGNAANQAGNSSQAVDYYEQSLVIAKAIPDQTRQVRALDGLILGHRSLGQLAKVQEYQRQQAAIAPPATPQERYQQALQTGQQLQKQGTAAALQEAVLQLEMAIALAKELKNPTYEAVALLALATVQTDLGNSQIALDYFNQVLQQLSTLDSPNLQIKATTYLALGRHYGRIGDKQQALTTYNKALVLFQEINNPSGQSTAFNNIANVYVELADYPKALATYDRALQLARSTQDTLSEAKTLNNIGLTYLNLGQYQRSLDYYNQALPLARAQNARLQEAILLNNFGTVYLNLGQHPKALDYYNQALALLQDVGDQAEQVATLGNIGTVYSYDNPAQAIVYYQRALALAQAAGNLNEEGVLLSNLGQTYAEQQQYAQAVAYYNRVLPITQAIGDRLTEAQTISKLARVAYAQQDYRTALAKLQQSLQMVQQIGDRRSEALILREIGKVYLRSNQLNLAEQALLQSIQVFESIRADAGSSDTNQISIFEEQASTYRLLQRALVAQGKSDRALEITERGRARAFVALLARRIDQSVSPDTIAAPNLQQIRQVARAQQATLVQYSILYDDLRPFASKQSTPSTLLAWVIEPTGKVTLRSTDLTALKTGSLGNLIATARDNIGVRSLRAASSSTPTSSQVNTANLRQLHQLLIQPIADLLPNNPRDRIVFLPQAELFLVPFAALTDAQGRHLIERHTVAIAPSIQVLQLTQQQRARTKQTNQNRNSALIVGNPTMPTVVLEAGEPPESLPALPGAEQEAREIANLLNTQPLIGDAANEQAVLQQLPQARLVHLATHGLLNDVKNSGIPGAIALAPTASSTTPASSNNGLLTADKILSLRLTAELVVLSACDTGRGTITGDGVIGLSRAFVAAGVPSLVVSLWQVPDVPTALLMREFYQALEKEQDKAQALRQAMLVTLKQYPNPRDWAAFTLIGAAE